MSLGALVTGLGRALVSWGLGGGSEDDATAAPLFLALPTARPLYSLSLPVASSLYTITITRPMARLHVGDTALLDPIYIRDRTDTLTDPATFTVTVLPPSGTPFSLVYGTAPTTGDGDAVIRRAAGTYAVQIEVTSARGVGLYRGTVATTSGRSAEPFEFRVLPLGV